MYSCLNPSFKSTPERLGTTQTSITILWAEPDSNGCPLISFSILRNSGAGDSIGIDVDPALVSNKPSLRQYTIGGLTQTGNVYMIKVRAYNSNGYSDSNILYAVLAAVPDTPSPGPISDASVTN